MEVGEGAPATTEAAKGIKAIDKTTVHRICSGQVVLTLATGVKELVENSLDAGATSIEVRLKDHGATLLEVLDNGKGVEEHNFEGLTLKHHTSKIQDFGDLVGVKTFGFRGEALSSLCALSDLTITTRHGTSPVATKLTYDHNGTLVTRTATSRQVGTTVSLQGLFTTLPVRHKEFLRNAKKEFNKMVQVLYAYCLISTGVRITCTNQNEKGKKSVVVSTSGHPTIRENLSSIFGAKQAGSLLEFEQESASQDVLEEFGIPVAAAAAAEPRFSLEGLVSTCSHGQGRSSTDRQFYFINSRPCDPTKVMKLLNEIFHQYNRHQFPCVVLNIRLKEGDADINVTPDKRQILVCHERLLLATIKTSLMQLYQHIPSTYSMHNTSLTPTHRIKPSHTPSHSPSTPTTPTTPTSSTSSASSKKLSALAQRFGRPSFRSPQPATPSGVTGLKRPLSLGNTNTSSSDNKQPKLMSFLKKSPKKQHTSNGDTSPASDLCIEGVYPLPSPGPPGDSQGDTQENTQENTQEDTQEDTQGDTQGDTKEDTKEDTQGDTQGDSQGNTLMNTEPGSQEEGGEGEEPCRETLENMKTDNDDDDLHSPTLHQSVTSHTNGHLDSTNTNTTNECDTGGTTNGHTELGHVVKDESPLTCDDTPSKPSGHLMNGGHTSPSLTGVRNGSGFKVTPQRASIPVPVPSSSSCKKIHTTTSDFLNNLKARKCLLSTARATPGRNNSTQRHRDVDVKPSTSPTEQVDDEEVGLMVDGMQNNDQGSVEECENGVSNGGDGDDGDGGEAPEVVMICEEEEQNSNDTTQNRKCKLVPFDIKSLKRKLQRTSRQKDKHEVTRRFKAKISPTDNVSAEEELRKEITKDMFAEMEILGQFNLGFIITRLGQDLFIIDQHATDEKYNFETLQQTYVLQNQRLIAPQTLELTAIGEATLLDNVEIFRKNGYEFLVRDEQPIGRRVSLTTMPVSRGWEFGRGDVEELIFMLSDSPGTMCRPSRVRTMFASRACRKSIMIGTALTPKHMKELVTHMGEIEQPWNCPHGRPTMRHLVNLSMLVPLHKQE